MNDKAIQVAMKRFLKCNKGSQTEDEVSHKGERGTQCGITAGSYGRNNEHKKWRYDNLVARLGDKEMMIEWLMVEGLLAKKRLCERCSAEMTLVKCDDRSDEFKWECRKQENGKRHRVEMSIYTYWKLVEKSRMTLDEILKFTYFWCQDLDQAQIKHELGLNSNTAVDWDSFCREVCEVTLLESSETLGGEGKTVQIDESKFGKRK